MCVLITFYYILCEHYIDEYYFIHKDCYNFKKEEYKIDNILCNNCLPPSPTGDDELIIY